MDKIYLGKGKTVSPKEGQNFKPFFSGYINKKKVDGLDDKYIPFVINKLKEPDDKGNTHTIVYSPYEKKDKKPAEVEKKVTKKDDEELPF